MHRQWFVRVGLVVAVVGTGCSKGPPDALVTPSPPPAVANHLASAAVRVVDADLDAKDPAQDYVGRYARATKRYGDDPSCARVEPSSPRGGARIVLARGRASCGSDEHKDEFVVDVAGDRLRLAPGGTGGPLAPWPDGSAPDGPAAIPLAADGSEGPPVLDALKELGLSPYRVRTLGRGTYRVVAVSGGGELLARDGSRETVRAATKKLCAANGESFGLLGDLAPEEIVRVRCPSGDARWESLLASTR